MRGGETHQINLRRRIETAALMGWRFFVSPRVPDGLNKTIMNSSKIVLRINAANPNHHLYNNNGTWWCHYTEHRPDFTKQRIRMSLQTPSLLTARAKRDRWFSQIQGAIV
jgi:hypothetical protein